MNIKTILYNETIKTLPEQGQHIVGHQNNNEIVVYQAYRHSIADFALHNQYLGGDEFSYNRMSWIKPNFLWMMYRCGWAEKEGQERVLAFWINKSDFESILSHAVLSSFNPAFYTSNDEWRKELHNKEVRLQWDPEHDPFGRKLTRKAIQLGLKGKILEGFGKKYINKIEDMTEFVKQQKKLLDNNKLDTLLVPIETVYKTTNEQLNEKIGIEKSV